MIVILLTCTNCVVCCACNGWHTGCLILACMKVNLIVKLCASSWLDTFIPLFLEKKKRLPYLESNFCSESKRHVLFSSWLYRNFYDFLNNHEIVAFEYGLTDCMSYVEHMGDKCILNKLNQLDVTLWKFFIAQHVSNAITFILRSWRLYVGVLLCFGV